MTQPLLTLPLGFSPQSVEKVERLLELLSIFHLDPVLGDAFVLHGGTALNIFYDDAPRLSEDIDLMFVAALELKQMQKLRPKIDHRLREVAGKLGYTVQATNNEHSGQTYRLKYDREYVKVDISYLSRICMMPPKEQMCAFCDPSVSYPVLQLPELIAGKVKAIMERTAARDLYDLFRLSELHSDIIQEPLNRALIIRAWTAADWFPQLPDPIHALEAFKGQPAEFYQPLLAMLRQDDVPTYETMLSSVMKWMLPLADLSIAESEYIGSLTREGDYRPELLFKPWPEVLNRALLDPVMKWKAQHLRVRASLD